MMGISLFNNGKITVSDLVKALDPLKKVLPAIQDADQIIPELQDIDEDEVAELLETAQNHLGFGEFEDLEDIVGIIRHGVAIYRRHR